MQWEDYAPVSTLRAEENPLTKARYTFVDVHGHQREMASASAERIQEIVSAMDTMNMGVMVNLSGGSGEVLAQAIRNAEAHAPGRIVHFANVDFSRVSDSGFGEKGGGAAGPRTLKMVRAV